MAWNYRELKNFTLMESISIEGLKYQPADTRILKIWLKLLFSKEI